MKKRRIKRAFSLALVLSYSLWQLSTVNRHNCHIHLKPPETPTDTFSLTYAPFSVVSTNIVIDSSVCQSYCHCKYWARKHSDQIDSKRNKNQNKHIFQCEIDVIERNWNALCINRKLKSKLKNYGKFVERSKDAWCLLGEFV